MYQYKAKILKVLDGDTVDIDLDLGFNIVLSNQRVPLRNTPGQAGEAIKLPPVGASYQ